jgi:ubiquinone/menaquinone biosynthesis C-methylase UbiE
MPDTYIPALGYRWLTGLYDPVVRITTREATFKAALLDQAQIQPGQRVLDLACGTATLTIAAKQRVPGAELVGLDGDPAILKLARAKAHTVEVDIHFDEGLSNALPYAAAGFDAVLSSLFFHHLEREAKQATLREVWRVLRPGGALHVADWGRAQDPLMRLAFYGIQLLDGFRTTQDNVQGMLPRFMSDCGFAQVRETRRFRTVFGTLSLYQARKGPHPPLRGDLSQRER